ncbi:MAG TPA: hypothetical protein GX726_00080 [Clostridiales bacterium]|nr:hypothetical protein [Clostridiales bacterium]
MARKITGRTLLGSWAGILYFEELRPFFPDEKVTLEFCEGQQAGQILCHFNTAELIGCYSIDSASLKFCDLRNRWQLEFAVETENSLRGRFYADGKRDVGGHIVLRKVASKEA